MIESIYHPQPGSVPISWKDLSINSDLEGMRLSHLVAEASQGDSLKVGCVIADLSGKIIGVGWRQLSDVQSRSGGYVHTFIHAEYSASFGLDCETMAGCTVYVTLEPCSQRGVDLDSCTTLLVQLKPKRLVFSNRDVLHDKNTGVPCFGIERLRACGIEVVQQPVEDSDSDNIK